MTPRETPSPYVIREIPFELSKDYLDMVCLRQAVLRVARPPEIPYNLPRFSWDQLDGERDDIHVGLYPWDSSNAVGCCLIRRVSDWLQMRQVAVDDKLQGRGLGRLLVGYFENYAARNGFQNLFIEARGEAVGFYTRLGYTLMPDSFPNEESTLINYRLEKILQNGASRAVPS